MSATRPQTVAYIATSIDGFIAKADGALDWLPEPPSGEDYGWADFIAEIDAIVMGRHTFETVLGFDAWSYEGTPVLVLSSTLRAVPAHLSAKAEVACMEPQDLLADLAKRGYERVYIDGGKTIQSFLRHDLLDELVITTIPILLGGGIPLFGPLDQPLRWEHASTQVLSGGLVKATYRRPR
jgi:dihydrofolate reductase